MDCAVQAAQPWRWLAFWAMAEEGVLHLAERMRGRRVVVLTGAGISTESGIPDYRGPGTARRARNPIQYRSFVESEAGRRRYWRRSMVGFRRVRDALPNAGHLAIADLEEDERIVGVITQNVDGLHQKAGAKSVVELHGSLHRVRCLQCGATIDRDELQSRLEALNPSAQERALEIAPDGDAEVLVEDESFEVPACSICGGILKPDVVFFGESVPAQTVDAAWALFDRADLLLVVGSSLAVFSGYRFALRAKDRGMPLAIINLSATRASDFAEICITARSGIVLPELRQMLLERVG
jgi:NAD-dependent SIR2 family protein deacetylase